MKIKLSNISVYIILIGSFFGLIITTSIINASISQLLSKEINRVSEDLINDNQEQFLLTLEKIDNKIQRFVTEKNFQNAIENNDSLSIYQSLIKINSGNFPSPALMAYINYNDKKQSKNTIKHLHPPSKEVSKLIKKIESGDKNKHYQIIKNREKVYLVFSGRISSYSSFKKLATLSVIFSLAKNSEILKMLITRSKADCLILAMDRKVLIDTETGSIECINTLKSQTRDNTINLYNRDTTVSHEKNLLLASKQLSSDINLTNIHILIGQKTTLFATQQQQLVQIIKAVALVLILSALITSIISTKIIKRYVKQLTDYVQQDSKKPSSTFSNSFLKIDEFIEIAGAYNEVRQRFINEESERAIAETDKILLGQRLRTVQAQKMEALGTLTANVAHDFNNLLAIIKGNLDLIKLSNLDPAILEESLETIAISSDRGAALVSDLMLYVRSEKSLVKQQDFKLLIQSVLKVIPYLNKRDHIKLSIHIEKDTSFIVQLDQDRFSLALINLISNAKGGQLSIRLLSISRNDITTMFHINNDKKEYCLLEVADTGCGIDKAIKDKIFEPFFTTKKQGQGTGMGLSIVYEFVRESEGYIRVISNTETGSIFQLIFPIV